MLERLKALYGEQMITYGSRHQAYWFQTDEGETFGISKEAITDQEKQLLSTLFKPFSEQNMFWFSPAEKNWYQYFFANAPLVNQDNIRTIQGHFFKMEHVPEERQAIKEAISGFFKRPLVIWYDRDEAVIIHENPAPFLSKKRLAELSDALTSDFLANPVFFSGQLHHVNASLQERITFEKRLFQYVLANGDREKVTSFYQCLPAFLLKNPKETAVGIFSDAIKNELSDSEMLLTIRTYLKCNLNASLSAKHLFIHRNSLQYRIDKFIEHTAIDIRQFEEAAAVYFIFNLYSNMPK
ncbi:helix-turn-helix domain-containing protein [Bacillus sp. CLL-7-23]|uniref:Helix-turn-helix domain-containing protein n=1 Tax=Bacillus changyiensis TaxID=3004103 RepID=A0ABT4X8C3_9BACI|nr:helix-turn-helix domain-containing protein [Bacillus changyiensis]MDA7028435.1 helix-turn-helix domain-containing protein [Bacillus changyiensis]